MEVEFDSRFQYCGNIMDNPHYSTHTIETGSNKKTLDKPKEFKRRERGVDTRQPQQLMRPEFFGLRTNSNSTRREEGLVGLISSYYSPSKI
jgi:hypothetical protein